MSSAELNKHLIVLASSSPRRQELLRILGLSFVVAPPLVQTGNGAQTEVDETPLPNETPAELVQRLSRIKAEAIATNTTLLASTRVSSAENSDDQSLIIIAADTEVALENQILGKPTDAAEAVSMLQRLREQSHQVYSGLTVARISGEHSTFVTRLHQSTVWMRPYTDDEIAAYVASGDPLDKAGAYGIQNQSFAPVERLEGCFASVMGLPLGELMATFKGLGLSLPTGAARCRFNTRYPCCLDNL